MTEHKLPYFKCEQCPEFETEWKLKSDIHGRKRKDASGGVSRHKVYRIDPPKTGASPDANAPTARDPPTKQETK